MSPTIITAREVADLLGLHHTTVYEAAKRGEIPHRRIGKKFIFTHEAVVAWMTFGADDDPTPEATPDPPPVEQSPTASDLATVAKHAADICRHVAALLADDAGMTRRAALRRLRTCNADISAVLAKADAPE